MSPSLARFLSQKAFTMQCDSSSECINISRTFLKQLEKWESAYKSEEGENANMHSYFIKNITKWQCNWKVMAVANCNFHFYSMPFLLALYLWFSVNDGIVFTYTHTHSCFAVVAKRHCELRTRFSWQWNDFTISHWLLAVTMGNDRKNSFVFSIRAFRRIPKKKQNGVDFSFLSSTFFVA